MDLLPQCMKFSMRVVGEILTAASSSGGAGSSRDGVVQSGNGAAVGKSKSGGSAHDAHSRSSVCTYIRGSITAIGDFGKSYILVCSSDHSVNLVNAKTLQLRVRMLSKNMHLVCTSGLLLHDEIAARAAASSASAKQPMKPGATPGAAASEVVSATADDLSALYTGQAPPNASKRNKAQQNARRKRRFALTGSLAGTLCCWDVEKCALVHESAAQKHSHYGPVTAIFCDSQLLATGGRDACVLLWDMRTLTVKTRLLGHSCEILYILRVEQVRCVLCVCVFAVVVEV